MTTTDKSDPNQARNQSLRGQQSHDSNSKAARQIQNYARTPTNYPKSQHLERSKPIEAERQQRKKKKRERKKKKKKRDKKRVSGAPPEPDSRLPPGERRHYLPRPVRLRLRFPCQTRCELSSGRREITKREAARARLYTRRARLRKGRRLPREV